MLNIFGREFGGCSTAKVDCFQAFILLTCRNFLAEYLGEKGKGISCGHEVKIAIHTPLCTEWYMQIEAGHPDLVCWGHREALSKENNLWLKNIIFCRKYPSKTCLEDTGAM